MTLISTPKAQRLKLVLIILTVVSTAIGLILYAFQQNLNLFYTPSQAYSRNDLSGKTIRIGGVVKSGSVQKLNNLRVDFVLYDNKHEVKVQYRGLLPDLFKEGQTIVALGKLDPNYNFMAQQVLAKHDENYNPPGVDIPNAS